jgi:hypothetical protein
MLQHLSSQLTHKKYYASGSCIKPHIQVTEAKLPTRDNRAMTLLDATKAQRYDEKKQ